MVFGSSPDFADNPRGFWEYININTSSVSYTHLFNMMEMVNIILNMQKIARPMSFASY